MGLERALRQAQGDRGAGLGHKSYFIVWVTLAFNIFFIEKKSINLIILMLIHAKFF